MTDIPGRYYPARQTEKKEQLYKECVRWLNQLQRSAHSIRLLTLARNALKTYAGYKTRLRQGERQQDETF